MRKQDKKEGNPKILLESHLHSLKESQEKTIAYEFSSFNNFLLLLVSFYNLIKTALATMIISIPEVDYFLITPTIHNLLFPQLFIWCLIVQTTKVSFRVNFINGFCLFSHLVCST